MDDTLFVLGNGFDIHSCLPTRFCQFRKFVCERADINPGRVYNDMDKLFPESMNFQQDPKGGLNGPYMKIWIYLLDSASKECSAYDPDKYWADFEEDLGGLPYEDVLDQPEIQFDSEGDEDPFQTGEASQSMEQYISVNMLTKELREWIENVEETSPEIDKNLAERFKGHNNMFLSFNYTNTLEKWYGIDYTQVTHIHGFVDNETQVPDTIIFGHKDNDSYNMPAPSEEYMSDIDQETLKPVLDIISKHEYFYKNIMASNLKSLFFYGFSFSEVDSPYIEKILKSITTSKPIIYINKMSFEAGIYYLKHVCAKLGLNAVFYKISDPQFTIQVQHPDD
ncbi:AbiH family protein [Lacticaseibacillus paracasei]|uniref:Bacteriophage abortive infection AbiH n=1 Tax=Lacticaseibacillus paracasei TaxID=1597 RepID=A0A8B3GQT2_LACPA|nr:AbiH family protein [Lacticaseibacillus paracasei]MDE3303806.1 bacteriophage abortive infection AbiH family protein [Lacticaseibacillus paracasei]RNE05728.1 hypothetical protein FAM22278_02087 [Lacticaseibacillus paracasei]RNE29048.1 hypothetical protein FAM6012_02126 [Lacticaseibacillus paracasei]